MKVRKPAVAGSFYPGSKEQLISVLRNLGLQQDQIADLKPDRKITGGVVPHAGYVYSGRIALPFFQTIAASKTKFETIIILNPNHSGRGPAIALDIHDAWQTPLGLIPVDQEMSAQSGFEKSHAAHQFEHSAEVMLPFLQYFLPYSFQILPVSLSRQSPENCIVLAQQLKTAITKTGRQTLIIASSDFSHYVSPVEGALLDDKAIHYIKNLNTPEFYNTVMKYNISICGYGPIMALMEFAKTDKTESHVEILARGHSGQDNFYDEVVHYVCMLFFQMPGR
jgi:MEMO1 family protein